MKKLFLALAYVILIILYLLVVGLWIAIPEELTLNLSTSVFTLVLTAIVIIADRQRFQRYYLSGHFTKMVSTIVASVLIFFILAMLNFFGFKNPMVWDLSALRLNSLTDKSAAIVKAMKGDIRFTVFSQKKDHAVALSLIELYRHANKNVAVQAIDIDVRPDLVRQYNIVKAPTVVIEYNGRREYVAHTEELNFTNALIKLSRQNSPIIYFTAGHGEPALGNHSNDGISEFEAILVNSSFELRVLELMMLDKLPEDLSTLAIIGPRSGFNPRELLLIENFIKEGGKLLVAIDPQLDQDPLSSLRKMLEGQHLIIDNDFVIDSLNHVSGSDGTVPLVKELNRQHLITKEISSYVFFPLASSVGVDEGYSGRYYSLAESTSFPASWAEKDFNQLKQGKVNFDPSIDEKGPVSMAMAFESIGTEGKLSRLVLIGNSTLIKNQYAKFIGNSTLVANALSWLSLDGQIDSFNLPFGENEPVFISGTQIGTIFYVVVILLPILLFIVALVIYRRNRAQ